MDVTDPNKSQEHPFGPNYDKVETASKPVLNLYRQLSSSPQYDEKHPHLLEALKYFLGVEDKPDNKPIANPRIHPKI
ncbi:8894_t:CDS:2 [Ambispora leptoticha]|uniref:8894_t:CDS:1 n=1 Tax=Ambispora leptoticha TaxID=144679 RepID=A0A9N9FGB4_9GLOM|nr:8894_t:CDS:2 [Ambispora leptoticha]